MNKEERYTKYVEKVQTLNEHTKRRPLPAYKALSDFYDRYAAIAGILELKGSSRAHVLGLAVCMENLTNPASSLSLLSASFENVTKSLSSKIAALTLKTPTSASSQLIQWWLVLSLMTVVGLLELGKAKDSMREDVMLPDTAFQNHLLLLLFFESGYPTIAFKEMGEALGVPENKIKLFTAFFELLTLTFALIASSKEEEGLKKELVEDLMPKIDQDFMTLLQTMDQNAHLEQIRLSLEKGDHDNLILTCEDLLATENYSKEELYKDISAMKELFIRLKQACQDARARPSNVIHVAG